MQQITFNKERFLNRLNNMEIGKCLRCDEITEMTKDHVIPEWLLKTLPLLGLEAPKQNVELVCAKCNQDKGGKIDYAHPKSLETMKLITARLYLKIKEQDGNFTL